MVRITLLQPFPWSSHAHRHYLLLTHSISNTPARDSDFGFRDVIQRIRNATSRRTRAETSDPDDLSSAQSDLPAGQTRDENKTKASSADDEEDTNRPTLVDILNDGARKLMYGRRKKSQQYDAKDNFYGGVSAEGEDLIPEAERGKYNDRIERLAERMAAKAAKRQARKRWNQPFEHKYSTAVFRISPQKLQKLADQINHKPIDHAILQMQFSEKRASQRIKSTLCLARDHAIAKGLDRYKMVVSEAWVNKGDSLGTKYINIMGRGRFGIAHHPKASLHIVLRHGKSQHDAENERLEKARRIVRNIGTGGVARTARHASASRPAWGY